MKDEYDKLEFIEFEEVALSKTLLTNGNIVIGLILPFGECASVESDKEEVIKIINHLKNIFSI